MKTLVTLLLIISCFSACKDSSIDESLLDPDVRTVKEFVENLKENKRFYSLTLINGYNPDEKSDEEFYFDSLFNVAYTYTKKYGLKSTGKWTVEPFVLRSSCSDYSVEIKDVYVPFDITPTGDQPVHLRFGFDPSQHKENICDFEIVTLENSTKDGIRGFHRISYKQSQLLNCQ